MTTKQVRKRLDFDRPVSHDVLLECIDVASRAPMGSNQERNKWLIIDDQDLKDEIAAYYLQNATPYLHQSEAFKNDDRGARVVDSAQYLAEHMAEAPALVLPAAPRRHGRSTCFSPGRLVGFGLARRVELSAGAALPRARVLLDDAAYGQCRRGRRNLGHPRVGDAGRACYRWPITPVSPSLRHLDVRLRRSRSSTAGSNQSPSGRPSRRRGGRR